MENQKYFLNELQLKDKNIHILDPDDGYAENFGKQWKIYQNVQIDSFNNFNISENFLKKIIFNELLYLKNKTVLEIGCGSGRFTEHIVKFAKECVSIDMSSAIYYNVARGSNNLMLIKADFTKLLANKKFDIIICRGMLQHTPDPFKSIEKLYEFSNTNGEVFFDIYPLPKIGFLHPKYLIWRPFFKTFIKYETLEKFLKNNINKLLFIKRNIKKIFFNSNFISDLFIPVWDYENKINLTQEQLKNWSILDTLDGLYAYYDKPQTNMKIIKFLKKINVTVLKYNKKLSCYSTKNK